MRSTQHASVFYKVVDGINYCPSPMLGPHVTVARGIWHNLTIHCVGNQISASLDGAEVLKPITDTSFNSGKIGYWTKSDSECYFADTDITYQRMQANPGAGDSAGPDGNKARTQLHRPENLHARFRQSAQGDCGEIFKGYRHAGRQSGAAAPLRATRFMWARTKFDVNILLPLIDRNGDTMGAVAVTMPTFRGQTEENAITRAMPICA